MAREYVEYQAHELRNGVVHTSDDELVTLLGNLSTLPGREAKYILEFPALMKKEPTLNMRFIPKSQIPQYIQDCQRGKSDTPPEEVFPIPIVVSPTPIDISPRDIPPNFDTYPSPDLNLKRTAFTARLTDDRPGRFKTRFQESLKIDKRRILVEMEQMEINFITEEEEGAYVFVVETEPMRDDVAGSFSVVVYNKEKTFFPESEDDDLADLLDCTVNLSCKNGILWFVHPIYFVEQLLNVELSDEVKEEIVGCDGLPSDLPADDDTLVGLQRGYDFRGLKKVWIEVDKEEEDPCVRTDNIKFFKEDERIEFSEFIKKL